MEEGYKKLEGYKELKCFIKRRLFLIMKNPYFQKKRKTAALILFLNTGVYRRLVFISEEKKR